MNNPVRMVLAGAGFMGREHIKCTRESDCVSYVAVVDTNPQVGQSLAAEYELPFYQDIHTALTSVSPDAVDICTPTVFHLPMIQVCAERGVSVLCEKPLAHTPTDAQAIARIVQSSGIRLMVAQVIRFWPEYRYVRQLTKNGTFGRILAIDCKRLSCPPSWNSWMLNSEIRGGAIIDMQVHDLDFVYQLLGKPSTLSSLGLRKGGGVNKVATMLTYPSPTPVLVEASMLMPKSFPFRMYFKIEFEQATAEMDFWRPKGQRLKVFPDNGDAFCPEMDHSDAYRSEIEYFARQLAANQAFDEAPFEETIESLNLCFLSAESCANGRTLNIQ